MHRQKQLDTNSNIKGKLLLCCKRHPGGCSRGDTSSPSPGPPTAPLAAPTPRVPPLQPLLPHSTETGNLLQYGLIQLLIKKLFLVLLISGKSALDWLLYLDFSRALGSSLLMVFRCRMKAAFAGDMLNHSRLPLLMLQGERRATFLKLPSSLCPSCHGHSVCLRNRHWGNARPRTISAVLLIIKRTHQRKMGNALTYRFCSFFLLEIFCWEIFMIISG